jgi:hypothetical protein
VIIRRTVLRIWAKRQLKRFKEKCRHPQKYYKNTWKIIRSNSTDPQIKAIKSFENSRNLPLTDYADYKEAFRMTLGSKVNPLNGEPVHFWATTTGSSGNAKIFPISKSVDKTHVVPSKWRVAMLIDRFDIYSTAPELIFVMPGDKVSFAPNRPVGQIGYYHYKNAMPKWLENKFTFTKTLYQQKQNFNDWHVMLSLLQDCTGISTSIPARVTHFLNQMNEQRDEIIERLKTGSWPKELALKTTQERIDFLLKALRKPIKHPRDIWPSFKFLCVWKTGESCGKQLAELQLKYDFTDVPIIDQFYNATEGLYNIPLLEEEGGPANIFGIILDFYHAKTETYFWPWELEKGEIYELVITNTMGLSRYRTFDLIECTGYYEKVPKIKFHSRSFPEISLGWGNVSEKQLVAALDNAVFTHLSDIYFTLNEQGNGLLLVSAQSAHEHLAQKVEDYLKSSDHNYAHQQEAKNFSPIQFSLISHQKFNMKMLENPNNKRLLLS